MAHSSVGTHSTGGIHPCTHLDICCAFGIVNYPLPVPPLLFYRVFLLFFFCFFFSIIWKLLLLLLLLLIVAQGFVKDKTLEASRVGCHDYVDVYAYDDVPVLVVVVVVWLHTQHRCQLFVFKVRLGL